MKLIQTKSEEICILIAALLVAWILAANQGVQYPAFSVFARYGYWTCRILIEATFFTAALYAVEKYLPQWPNIWVQYLLAVFVSLAPFTLAITAMDLIVGLPELGLNELVGKPVSRGREFVFELFYLLDDHVFLGGLLISCRLMNRCQHQQSVSIPEKGISPSKPEIGDQGEVVMPAFIQSLEPILEGEIFCMEAKEHYISVMTSQESRMVLHRFSDAIRQMPEEVGMQVHRSHWVAHAAVEAVVIEGQNMKINLTLGTSVPVSRTFRTAVEHQYSR